MAKYLARMGHKIYLISPDKNKTSKLNVSTLDGVNIVTYPAYNTLFKFIAFQPAAVSLNLAMRFVEKPDLIHTFSLSPSNLAVALFSKLSSTLHFSKAKILVDWDDWWGRGGPVRDWGSRLIGFGTTFIEEKTPMFADAVTVVSDVLEKRALKLGIKRVFKVPNGSNVDGIKIIPKMRAREILGLPKDRIIILHLSFTDLTQMAKEVGKSHPEALFLVVGDMPRYAWLRIKHLEKLSNVKYIGSQPYSRINLFLSAADILLLKTENEISEVARWPMRIGDYLVAGKPIISGDIGEIGKVLREGNCALLAKPGDPESYAKKIVEMIEHPNWWEEMGERAIQTAKRYSWPTIAQSVENIYNDLMAQEPRP